MKRTPTHIARALFLATQGKSDHEIAIILGRFKGYLRRARASKQLPKILAVFKRLQHEEENAVHVSVTTARPVAEHTLSAGLATVLKKKPILAARTDPSLLGGAVLRIGDTEIDGSMRNALHQLSERLQHSRS